MIEHKINLNSLDTNQRGLEQKRQKCWARLDEDERRRTLISYNQPITEEEKLPPFGALVSTKQRTLYVLAVIQQALSVDETVYLLLARWLKNVDRYTVRARLAELTNDALVRELADGRFRIMPTGWKALAQWKEVWVRKRMKEVKTQTALRNYKKGIKNSVA